MILFKNKNNNIQHTYIYHLLRNKCIYAEYCATPTYQRHVNAFSNTLSISMVSPNSTKKPQLHEWEMLSENGKNTHKIDDTYDRRLLTQRQTHEQQLQQTQKKTFSSKYHKPCNLAVPRHRDTLDWPRGLLIPHTPSVCTQLNGKVEKQ